MNHPSDPLPLLPAELLRRYSCAEPTDTRFRAIARLRQTAIHAEGGLPIGYRVRAAKAYVPTRPGGHCPDVVAGLAC